jgi:hypothetical protein
MTKIFGGWDAAVRRPDGSASRPYHGKRRILSCTLRKIPTENVLGNPASIR